MSNKLNELEKNSFADFEQTTDELDNLNIENIDESKMVNVPTPEQNTVVNTDTQYANNMEQQDFDPTKLSNEIFVPKSKVEVTNYDRIYTISKVSPNPIRPDSEIKYSKTGTPMIETKIKFEFKNGLVANYGKARYFPQGNKVSSTPIIFNMDVEDIAKETLSDKSNEAQLIKAKFAVLKNKEISKITDYEFYNDLIGKKVLLKKTSGNYNGKDWVRNDIYAFVESDEAGFFIKEPVHNTRANTYNLKKSYFEIDTKEDGKYARFQ